MQIRPQETFPVLYQISDPSDAAIYYARAVMRNSVTGAIIKINNLNYLNLKRDAGNSRRFSALLQSPPDISGLGFWIDITVSLYNDSGYTIKNTTYQENIDKYLVAERWNVLFGGGGSGNSGPAKSTKDPLDYTKLTELIRSEISLLLPTNPESKVEEVISQGQEIKDLILATQVPAAPKIDLETHTKTILKEIGEYFKKIPEFDSKPLLKKIDSIKIPEPDLEKHFEKLLKEIRESFLVLQNSLSEKPDNSPAYIPDSRVRSLLGRSEVPVHLTNRVKDLTI